MFRSPSSIKSHGEADATRGIVLRFNPVRVPATSSRTTTSEHDDHRRAILTLTLLR